MGSWDNLGHILLLHTAAKHGTNSRDMVITQKHCSTEAFYSIKSIMSKQENKRKVDVEYRTFKAQLSVDYFVMKLNGKALFCYSKTI